MSKTGDMVIRVYGHPQPRPQKKAGTRKMGSRIVPVPISDDYRTRTLVDPITGEKKIQKFDKGYKMRWFNHVRECVQAWMFDNRREPFDPHHPIALGCLFFVQKAKSSKLVYPTGTPDFDNLRYGIPNVLKRTPDKKRGLIKGPYPNGVAFYDDSQLVWTANPDGVLWSSASNPPGVLITIIDLLQRPDSMEWGRDIDKEVCAELRALQKEVFDDF